MHLDELLTAVKVSERLDIGEVRRPDHLAAYVDALSTQRPWNVAAVIALPRVVRQRRVNEWTRLITIARFRTAYSIIDRLAKALAPTALTTGVVPIVTPIHERDIDGLTPESVLVRQLLRFGFVLYEESVTS